MVRKSVYCGVQPSLCRSFSGEATRFGGSPSRRGSLGTRTAVMVALGEEMTMRFRDQMAVITAAASGIGKATAEIIGSEGGIVVGVVLQAALRRSPVDLEEILQLHVGDLRDTKALKGFGQAGESNIDVFCYRLMRFEEKAFDSEPDTGECRQSSD